MSKSHSNDISDEVGRCLKLHLRDLGGSRNCQKTRKAFEGPVRFLDNFALEFYRTSHSCPTRIYAAARLMSASLIGCFSQAPILFMLIAITWVTVLFAV